MANPYLGELRLASFVFAPKGWALCNGQTLPINQNQALFSILGVRYGGDGVTTFALPDLRGRAPLHQGSVQGSTFTVGQSGGAVAHTLTAAEMPSHTHQPMAARTATTASPTGAVWASTSDATYAGAGAASPMSPAATSSVGGGLPHENRPPYLVLNWMIALRGVFPSRN